MDQFLFFLRLYYMYFVFDYTTVRTIFTFLNWMHVLFYTFVKSYYWKQIFYVMSILCTFNMYKLTYHVLITVHHWVISPHHIIFHFSTIHFIHKLLGVSRIYSKNLVCTELSFLMYSQFEKKMKIPYK